MRSRMRAKLQLARPPEPPRWAPRSSTPCSPWPHPWRRWRPSCSPSRASARPQAIAPSSSSPPPLRPRALLSCSSPSPIRGLTLRSSASAPWPRASEAHFCGRCGASTTPSSPAIERNGSRRFPRYPPPSSCFWYPPWTVGCPLPSPRRCRFCPASASISRGRQKLPAPKRRSQPPIASQPSGAPPWRGSGARGSASSSCSPS